MNSLQRTGEVKVTGVHHVKITIPGGAEAQARAFYCDVLGLREIPKPTELQGRGGVWLDAGNMLLYLAIQDDADRSIRNHIGYSVTNLDEWRERLRANGVEVRECLPVVGHERFECQDPFGNRMEIQQVTTTVEG